MVLKVGTSTLTAGSGKISRGKIEDMARQILELRNQYDIVLVSSGAIATARQFVNITGWDTQVASKQAMSAIGQPKLMQIYNEVFSDFDLRIAQCLMTYRDFENPNSCNNTLNTINELLKYNYIPIINENDTVSTVELDRPGDTPNRKRVFGDNDKLSGLVMTHIDADLLVLLSDIDGLYSGDPNSAGAKLITDVNAREWPVPLPHDVTLEDVRNQLLDLEAEFVWLDVLCLRQASDYPDPETRSGLSTFRPLDTFTDISTRS